MEEQLEVGEYPKIFKDIYHYRLGKNILDKSLSDEEKINEIKRFLGKLLLSKNLNILIGSGCSVSCIPLMGQSFTKIKPKLKGTLGKFENMDDIEGYLNWLVNAINFNIDDNEIKRYKSSFDITINALIESMPKFEHYNLDKESINEELLNSDIDLNKVNETLINYQSFFNSIFDKRSRSPVPLSPVNIFTTNYDLFIESALEKSNVHYTTGFQGGINRIFNSSMFNFRYVDTENRYKKKWDPVKRFAKVYKLHGSTNWINDGKKIYQTESSTNSNNQVMIYPSYVKHDITNQTPYSELFRELTLNLQKPNSVLIVIGFGFPDEHINQLIEQALNNEDFILLIFGNYEEEKIKNFYDRNNSKNNIHLIGGDYEEIIDEEKEKKPKGKLHYFENIFSEFLETDLSKDFKNDGTEGDGNE